MAIPQPGIIGVTQSEQALSRDQRREQLLGQLGQMLFANKELKEQQRQFDTRNEIENALSVLENQYGGNWAHAIESDDPVIRSLFSRLYGDQGEEIYTSLRGNLAQTPEQIVQRGGLRAIETLGTMPQGGTMPGGAQENNVFPSEQYSQELVSWAKRQQEQSGQTQKQTPQTKQVEVPGEPFGFTEDDLVDAPIVPQKRPDERFSKPNYSELARVHAEPGAIPALGRGIANFVQRTREGMKDSLGTYPHEQAPATTSVPSTQTQQPFADDMSTIGRPSEAQREMARVAPTYTPKPQEPDITDTITALYPNAKFDEKDMADMQEILQYTGGRYPKDEATFINMQQKLDKSKEVTYIEETIVSPNAPPEAKTDAVNKLDTNTELFVATALKNPESVKKILSDLELTVRNNPAFDMADFMKKHNLPDGARAILDKAYTDLTERERAVYKRTANAVTEDFESASKKIKRNTGAKDPAVISLKAGRDIYDTIAAELNKGYDDRASIVNMYLPEGARRDEQFREARYQFDRQAAQEDERIDLQRRKLGLDMAIAKWQFDQMKKAAENPAAGGYDPTVLNRLLTNSGNIVELFEKDIQAQAKGNVKKQETLRNELLVTNSVYRDAVNFQTKFYSAIGNIPISEATAMLMTGGFLGFGKKLIQESATPYATLGNYGTVNYSTGNQGGAVGDTGNDGSSVASKYKR